MPDFIYLDERKYMRSALFVLLLLGLTVGVIIGQTAKPVDTTNTFHAVFLEKSTAEAYTQHFTSWKQKPLYSATLLAGETPLSLEFVWSIDSLGKDWFWLIQNYGTNGYSTLLVMLEKTTEYQLKGTRNFQLFENNYDDYQMEFVVLLDSKMLLFRWNSPEKSSTTAEAIPVFKSNPIKVGKPMPEVSINTLSGFPYRLRYQNDSITVINSWNTYCQPCVLEMPELNKHEKKYSGRKIKFISVAWNKESEVKEFLKQNPFRYQHTLFNDSTFSILGGTFPRNVIIDAKGIVVYDHIGYDSLSTQTFGMKINNLLKAKE